MATKATRDVIDLYTNNITEYKLVCTDNLAYTDTQYTTDNTDSTFSDTLADATRIEGAIIGVQYPNYGRFTYVTATTSVTTAALTATGTTTMTGAMSISGEITATGELTSAGDWTQNGDTVFNGTVNFNGDVTFGESITIDGINADYADVSEYYAADAEYEPGTVLTVGGDYEVTAATDVGQLCFGIVTTAPALAMNSGIETKGFPVNLALVGRIPAKVYGEVTKGDLLYVSDEPGCLTNINYGYRAVAIALEDGGDSGDTAMIEVAARYQSIG